MPLPQARGLRSLNEDVRGLKYNGGWDHPNGLKSRSDFMFQLDEEKAGLIDKYLII